MFEFGEGRFPTAHADIDFGVEIRFVVKAGSDLFLDERAACGENFGDEGVEVVDVPSDPRECRVGRSTPRRIHGCGFDAGCWLTTIETEERFLAAVVSSTRLLRRSSSSCCGGSKNTRDEILPHFGGAT